MKEEIENWCAELHAPHDTFRLNKASDRVASSKTTMLTRSSEAAVCSVLNSEASKEFNPDERLSLTRAWIKSALSHPTSDLLEFWNKVHLEYSDIVPLSGTLRTAEELRVQWDTMLPSLVEFLTLFAKKWKQCQINLRYALARRKEAFRCAAIAYRVKKSTGFQDLATAWELANHEKWQDVMKILILQEEDVIQMLDGRPKQPNARGLKLTREIIDLNQEDRRGRQRRLSEDHKFTILPQTAVSEEIQLKQAVTSGIQLEVDIMTRSEDGLSAEAIEYLRLRRLQILQKLRGQVEQQLWR
ncbi:unnamed protein product [Phytophthora lilii]|uniref:Unnamed protein product n=1 Tax=Phytophthora lilii TaxID=2077276 RepID=A0A9W6YIU2_9STRA|nr:unnamed protein product [Phytophthora lilii]